MIRSRTVNTIHELAAQGKSIQDIAISLGIARNTVRKYLRHPELCRDASSTAQSSLQARSVQGADHAVDAGRPLL